MSFNCPYFIKEFQDYVLKRNFATALEVGCLSGELKDALERVGVSVDGIDLFPQRDDVVQCDIRDFDADGDEYDLVFSSGLLEYYPRQKAREIVEAMANVGEYILNYVPNKNCLAYQNAKKRTPVAWKDERDFTADELALLHEEAGLWVIETGFAGKEWVKRFGPEESEPYLVYCLAKRKKRK